MLCQSDAQNFPETYVNGELILNKRLLYHGDRVIIGQHHVFRFCNPENHTANPDTFNKAQPHASVQVERDGQTDRQTDRHAHDN